MPNLHIKNAEELAIMRESGRLLAKVFGYLDGQVSEGISTMDINDLAETFIVDNWVRGQPVKGSTGFPTR